MGYSPHIEQRWICTCLALSPGLTPTPNPSTVSANMINITPTQLRKAANIQEQIQSLQKELVQILGGLGETATIEAPRKSKKRKMSAQGLANIRAAAKARWAKIRAMKAGRTVQKPTKKMSAAAKARLSALAKARWAKAKQAGKTRL